MDWTDVLDGIVSFLFSLLSSVVSIILAPIDIFLNALLPGAQNDVSSFFLWINSTIQIYMDFTVWLFYVTGIQPSTWTLIMSVLSALLLLFLVTLPIKIIFRAYRGLS